MTVIAIDFDDTYTLDPAMWTFFEEFARGRGHRVILCTARADLREERLDVDAIVPSHIERVYCNGDYKRRVCKERGINVDVWIDDAPDYICEPNIGFNV